MKALVLFSGGVDSSTCLAMPRCLGTVRRMWSHCPYNTVRNMKKK